MRDEYDDRIYQAHRHNLATNIAGIVNAIAYAFDRLHAQLYSAPWSRQAGAERPCNERFTII